MNFARLETSFRLKRVLAFLRGRGNAGATSLEILQRTKIAALTPAISELRKNGVQVLCKFERKTEGGESVYRYRLGGSTTPDTRPLRMSLAPRVRQLEEALGSMLESYEWCIGERPQALDSPLPEIARDVVRGYFVGAIPLARAALPKSP